MDAVFAENGNPLISDTPERVLAWIDKNDEYSYRFYVLPEGADRLLTTSEYLRAHKQI